MKTKTLPKPLKGASTKQSDDDEEYENPELNNNSSGFGSGTRRNTQQF
jgi:hypothetical protein